MDALENINIKFTNIKVMAFHSAQYGFSSSPSKADHVLHYSFIKYTFIVTAIIF